MTDRLDLSGTGTSPAAPAPLVISLGRPNAGREWDLRRLTVLDVAVPQATYNGVVFVVAGTRTDALDPGNVRDTTACGIPGTATYSRGTIILQSNEELQVWCFSLPAGLEVLVTAQVETERDR